MESSNAQSVGALLLERISKTPDSVAFLTPSEGSSWKPMSWKDFGERVRNVACGLRALGVKNEERCAILASTRIEWIIADSGILCHGAATTTVYPSNTADECAYILQDSGTVVVFAENKDQVAKLVQKRAELPNVKKVITFDAAPSHEGWVIPLAELEELGKAEHAKDSAKYEANVAAITKDKLATLIYTSGTTGKPKGVELLHDCWIFESEAIDKMGLLRPEDVQFLWLPLSHVFGKLLQVAQFRLGFQTAVDGRVDRLVESLGQVKPTFVSAVPRIFEKVYNKVIGGAKAGGGAKWAIFKWGLEVGKKVSALQQKGESPGPLLALQHALAAKLVHSKLQQRFGGRLRFFVSGSAPLSRDMSIFFHSMGVLILEGYGMTETSAASFVNLPQKYKFGTVGPALPGIDIKIAKEDGEILLKGRGIMRGYHGLKEATAEALDAEGWLHTGDIGELDADGYLRITDRKKDLIKTSGGKYVAPQDLEGRFKTLCPYVSQIVVHGNSRNFCTALVSVDPEAITAWAKESGLGTTKYEEIARHPKTKDLIKPYIDQLNAQLANYERIGKFAILPRDLTLEDGDLTPSLKVKRKVVETKFKDILDGFYATAMEAA
ncbi:MAG: long-chain fatty acid--CoA ligase [Deltaproteobacteria bacterium]|nr:long-chain fatty acid--CoA ligase [Deltaproteobacteria bacterium]